MAIANLRGGTLEEKANGKRIRLVLLDDHLLVRESLAMRLASEADFELVAECTTSHEALKSIKESEVDVILLDIGLAKEFIPAARKARYSGKALVIAGEVDVTDSAIVLKSGASGIFLQSASARLVQAIRMVANGKAWVDQKVIRLFADRYPRYGGRWWGNLTEREQAVLSGIVDGMSNRTIGDNLGVSESTIKATLQHLFTKSGVRTRSQLVRIALEAPPSTKQ